MALLRKFSRDPYLQVLGQRYMVLLGLNLVLGLLIQPLAWQDILEELLGMLGRDFPSTSCGKGSLYRKTDFFSFIGYMSLIVFLLGVFYLI